MNENKEYKIEDVVSELKIVNDKLNQHMLFSDNHALNFKDFVPAFSPWVATMIIFVIGASLLNFLPEPILKIFEFISSWICTIVILVCGVFASNLAAKKSKKIGLLISISYSAIFTCYLGYITVNYGSSHPIIAAIGFNLATIGQALAIFFATQMITRVFLYDRKN